MNQDINDVVKNIRQLQLGATTIAQVDDVSLMITKSETFDMVFEVTLRHNGKQRHITYTNYNNNDFINQVHEHIRQIKEVSPLVKKIYPSAHSKNLTQQIPIQMAFSEEHLVEIFEDLLVITRNDVAKDFMSTKSEDFFAYPKAIQDKYVEEIAISKAIDAFNSSINDFVEKYSKVIDTESKQNELDQFIKSLDNKELIIELVERKE